VTRLLGVGRVVRVPLTAGRSCAGFWCLFAAATGPLHPQHLHTGVVALHWTVSCFTHVRSDHSRRCPSVVGRCLPRRGLGERGRGSDYRAWAAQSPYVCIGLRTSDDCVNSTRNVVHAGAWRRTRVTTRSRR